MAIRSDTARREQSYLRDMLAGAAGTVLEIGCGDGRLMWQYADLCRQVVGVDLPRELPTAYDGFPSELRFAAASAVHLPFRSGTFAQAVFALSF